jgi:hypothetical protein
MGYTKELLDTSRAIREDLERTLERARRQRRVAELLCKQAASLRAQASALSTSPRLAKRSVKA